MKIVVIAPIEEIVDMINDMRVRGDLARFRELEVCHGDLEAGLAEAIRAVERGADVIVSRGGTASLIAKNVEIPVVEIQVTAFDILRALRQIDTKGKVGVVFVRRLLFKCEELGELIGVPISEFFAEDVAGLEEELLAAQRDGVTTFIGDASSVCLLKRLGPTVVPINATKETIMEALLEAEKIANIRRKEKEKAELFRTILNASTDGIVAIDKEGRVSVLNSVAERVFHIDQVRALGNCIGDLGLDDVLGDCLVANEYEKEGVRNIRGKSYAVKRLPINLNGEVVGAVASIEDVTQLQQFEQVVRQKLNKKGLVAKFALEDLTGSSAVMVEVKERVCQYATTEATVLITGESGTGKERVAQSVHNLSKRRRGPFVAVNCAALPEALLESELFGYEEGAFTGAKKGGKAGLFELAHGGTVFLDEIGEMPLALQARLLRVLQEKEVMRVGASGVIPIDVRVLAATNKDLAILVKEKRFRADLYYRLDVLRLPLPPLRERIADIPELVRAVLHKVSAKNGKTYRITDAAIGYLQRCQWEGNIRELANVIERVTLLAKTGTVDEGDFQREFGDSKSGLGGSADRLVDLERQKIEQILLEEKYNYSRAAKRLGLSRTTLWRKTSSWGETKRN